MKSHTTNHRRIRAFAVAAASVVAGITTPLRAGVSVNNAGPVRQGVDANGQNVPAITISLSGQVALRNFLAGPGLTLVRPGSSVTLNFPVPGQAQPRSVTYTATNSPNTLVQLAKPSFLTPDVGVNGGVDVQRHSALRVEWHEQGSTEALIDLINDQVGYTNATGILSNIPSRGASVPNPTWVNTNQFTSGNTLGGHALSAGNFADTYDTSVFDRATGHNVAGGQNRIQVAIGEFKTQSFSYAGPATVTARTGEPGYGRGNPALQANSVASGLGFGGGRQAFRPSTVVDFAADKVDPESPTGQTYTNGPWTTAGANNIDSIPYAVSAHTFSANPGTGLSRVNAGDIRWLQTLGRLENGADFNNVTRSADTGQRIVFALNSGIDPTWATGENDDGNTSGTAAAQVQSTLGDGFRFSGKTSGVTARDAIAQSRLGIGVLSLPEARGAASAAPIRALDIAWEDQTDPSDASRFVRVNFDNIVSGRHKAILISHFNTVKAPNVTLLTQFRDSFVSANGRAPTTDEELAWWNARSSFETGIKGDPLGNVQAVIRNVIDSIGTAEAGLTSSSINNPADALYIAGFLTPGLLDFERQVDGGPQIPRTPTPQQLAVRENVRSNYSAAYTTDNTAGSSAQTVGQNAFYGARNPANAPAINGVIPITARDASGNPVANGVAAPRGNYLFGNFNQDGSRDFASVKESVNAALSLAKVELLAPTPGRSSIYTAAGGVTNSTPIASVAGSPGWATTANTKGDLIVLGDFNSDGRFDGRDLYLLARGASLSDDPNAPNASSDRLTAASGSDFDARVRNPNARLNKNAALDLLNLQTAPAGGDVDQLNAARAFLRQSGRAELIGSNAPASATILADLGDGRVRYTNDPTGLNAFDKLDVNRDGFVDRDDAKIVDYFVGRSYRNLNDQLSAVLRTDTNDGGTAFAVGATPLDPLDPAWASIPRRQVSLVDVELTDDAWIRSIGVASDLAVITSALLGEGLRVGDHDFDGDVAFGDLLVLAQNYERLDASLPGGTPGFTAKWSTADFDHDGRVGFADLLGLAQNYSGPSFVGDWAYARTVVPEPTTLVWLGTLTLLGLQRRGR